MTNARSLDAGTSGLMQGSISLISRSSLRMNSGPGVLWGVGVNAGVVATLDAGVRFFLGAAFFLGAGFFFELASVVVVGRFFGGASASARWGLILRFFDPAAWGWA